MSDVTPSWVRRLPFIFIAGGAVSILAGILGPKYFEGFGETAFARRCLGMFFLCLAGGLGSANTIDLLVGSLHYKWMKEPIHRDQRPIRFWLSILYGYLCTMGTLMLAVPVLLGRLGKSF